MLALHVTRPREAKRLLANLFAAPLPVVVTDHVGQLFEALSQRE